ncbi:MAG TPA: UPF0149 family protein [Spongiibacteraceae bacterium]|nr:UPF0149 family protein [Spongiibacteraceae bacterium]
MPELDEPLSPTEIDEPLSQAELDELDELLLQFAEQHEANTGEDLDGILSASELDGFMTAVLSGPEEIAPAEWFAAMFSGEPPDFEADVKVQYLFTLLMRHLNNIAELLAEDVEQFEPMFGYREVDGVDIEVPDEWCMGYLRGISLRAEQWESLWDDQPEALTTIALFGTPEGWDELEKLDEETQTGFRETLPAMVRTIYGYWQTLRNTPDPHRRDEPKIGRNDPCPCGSGKKYKQCCLH